MEEYNSSEELQRSVFVPKSPKKEKDTTDTAKVLKVIDLHIKRHNTTRGVQAEMNANKGRSLELQFGISAGIVEILEKIKSELR